ncbi:T9SS type A sorting domain-containing protein [Tenacibaculum sp. SG-28]|uniref:T9SS type A sorting domain-containing protein n=1 Tax=Tenacibaculum sp. SG-28 TaxID=754426 RepID=UPI001304FC01|nr:T9SS type A sorting domain-containing protein [Tenacibaculum sp. SG-28]
MKNITIPLGVTTIKDQTISFGASTRNIPKTIKVFLEDKRNNTYTNLRNENYRIRLKENTKDLGRFYLHITSRILVSEEPNSNAKAIQIYISAPRELTLTNVEKGRVKFSLYSELGSQIQTQILDIDGTCKISIPKLSTGMYFLKITTKKGDRYKKFIIKKID